MQMNTVHPQMIGLEKNMRDILELNTHILRDMSLINPLHMLRVKGPQELLERNMTIFVENGHKALDYLHEAFNIMEHQWFEVSDEVTRQTKETMKQNQKMAYDAMDNTAEPGERMTRANASIKKKLNKKENSSFRHSQSLDAKKKKSAQKELESTGSNKESHRTKDMSSRNEMKTESKK